MGLLNYWDDDRWTPWTPDATLTTTVDVEDTDSVPLVTFDEFSHLARVCKKDKKLAAIVRKLMDGCEVEIPF